MESYNFFTETRNELNRLGYPSEDKVGTPRMLEFDTGGHFGIEVSSMNSYSILSKAIELADKYKIKIARVIECRGIVRLPDEEIKKMVQLCSSRKIGLLLSIGPRAISDTGVFAQSPNGKRIGYRLRGMENFIHAIEDVKRAYLLGVRGFTVYDEGLLFYLNEMKKNNLLDKKVILKFSVHAGCANPISAKLLEDSGANTINVVPDLDINMLYAFRSLVKCPIDVFSDTAKAAGGLLRTYDMPKAIWAASPIYLKCGPISQPEQNHLPAPAELEERIKQTRNVVEHIERYTPEAKYVSSDELTLAVPCP